MDIMALLIGAALLVALYIFVSQPLRRAHQAPDTESQLETLVAQRESLYTQIRELDFDHATGKVTDADYTPLRDRLKAEAAGVLRQIDHLIGSLPAGEVDSIEQAVAARRKRRPAAADADLEAAIAARRKRAAALACRHCGNPLNPNDSFCARCGTPVATQVAR